jgi:hypothetical protein
MTRRSVQALAEMLGANIGVEKALDVVQRAAGELHLDPAALSRDDALAVLERVAAEPGLVGITARFAKSRVHLQWSAV